MENSQPHRPLGASERAKKKPPPYDGEVACLLYKLELGLEENVAAFFQLFDVLLTV